jgi:TetR/AcrR family transcriptional repressor of mexCD-oprJ operon
MSTNQGLHDRVSTAILDAGALVLSERGDGMGMGEVAGRAGVSRATLYRYFPRREDLVRALVEAAVDDAHRRLTEADLESVLVPEAMARLSRALISSGVRYSLLLIEGAHIDHEEAEQRLEPIIRGVFVRGVETGVLRSDLSVDILLSFFGGLLEVAIHMATVEGLGVEKASAAMTTMLLDGATNPGRFSDKG